MYYSGKAESRQKGGEKIMVTVADEYVKRLERDYERWKKRSCLECLKLGTPLCDGNGVDVCKSYRKAVAK